MHPIILDLKGFVSDSTWEITDSSWVNGVLSGWRGGLTREVVFDDWYSSE